jgi:hypothetical protein
MHQLPLHPNRPATTYATIAAAPQLQPLPPSHLDALDQLLGGVRLRQVLEVHLGHQMGEVWGVECVVWMSESV